MRLQVVVDSSGIVVGTIRLEPQQLADGSEIEIAAVALEGQTIHEIDFEEDVAELEIEEFHRRLGDLVRGA